DGLDGRVHGRDDANGALAPDRVAGLGADEAEVDVDELEDVDRGHDAALEGRNNAPGARSTRDSESDRSGVVRAAQESRRGRVGVVCDGWVALPWGRCGRPPRLAVASPLWAICAAGRAAVEPFGRSSPVSRTTPRASPCAGISPTGELRTKRKS